MILMSTAVQESMKLPTLHENLQSLQVKRFRRWQTSSSPSCVWLEAQIFCGWWSGKKTFVEAFAFSSQWICISGKTHRHIQPCNFHSYPQPTSSDVFAEVWWTRCRNQSWQHGSDSCVFGRKMHSLWFLKTSQWKSKLERSSWLNAIYQGNVWEPRAGIYLFWETSWRRNCSVSFALNSHA